MPSSRGRAKSGPRVAVGLPSALLVTRAPARASLTEALENEGFKVDLAPSYLRARYALFEATPRPDVAVLDLDDDELDAEGLARALVGVDALPVVFLSSSPVDGARIAGDYGSPLVIKPFRPELAVATIVMALEHDVRPVRRGVR